MRVLLDTNILLDVLLNREGFYRESSLVWQMAIEGHIDGYIAGNSIDNLSYILTKNGLSKEAVYVILRDIVADLTVTVIDHEIIQKVLKEGGSDIEDAIAYYSAIYSGVSHIVTRNAVDFIHDEATICTPSDFLRLMEAKV